MPNDRRRVLAQEVAVNPFQNGGALRDWQARMNAAIQNRAAVVPQGRPLNLAFDVEDALAVPPNAAPVLARNDAPEEEADLDDMPDFDDPPPEPQVIPDIRLNRPEKATKLPRFKPKYETQEEYRLRLTGSVITLYDEPVYVHDITRGRDTLTNERGLCAVAMNSAGVNEYYLLKDHGANFRSIEPGYLQPEGDGAFFLARVPARVYRQGCNRDNTRLKYVGLWNTMRLEGGARILGVLRGLTDRKLVQYNPTKELEQIVTYVPRVQTHQLRYSDHVATFVTPPKPKAAPKVHAEYRGRTLGIIENGVVGLDICDFHHPWVRDALHEVGLKAKEVE